MTERSFAPIIVREWCYGLSMSRWLNVADPDHLPHFSVSSAVNRPKSAGEPANACSAEVDKTTFDLEIGEPGIDVHIEPLDDLGRRVLGSADAEPATHIIPGQTVSQRRNVRQHIGTRPSGYGQCTYPTGSHGLNLRTQRTANPNLQLPAKEIGKCRCSAAARHMKSCRRPSS